MKGRDSLRGIGVEVKSILKKKISNEEYVRECAEFMWVWTASSDRLRTRWKSFHLLRDSTRFTELQLNTVLTIYSTVFSIYVYTRIFV